MPRSRSLARNQPGIRSLVFWRVLAHGPTRMKVADDDQASLHRTLLKLAYRRSGSVTYFAVRRETDGMSGCGPKAAVQLPQIKLFLGISFRRDTNAGHVGRPPPRIFHCISTT